MGFCFYAEVSVSSVNAFSYSFSKYILLALGVCISVEQYGVIVPRSTLVEPLKLASIFADWVTLIYSSLRLCSSRSMPNILPLHL